MRNPGFPVSFQTRGQDGLALQLTTARQFPARELIADGTIEPGILQLAEVLAAATPGGSQRPAQIKATSATTILITLDARVFSHDWHIAAILNLIENGIFIGQDEDPVIVSGIVSSAHLKARSIEETQSALVAAHEVARAAVLSQLKVPGWPTVPRDVLYDLVWTLSDPPSPDAAAVLPDRFWQINDLMTASAFEPIASPLDWLEDDLLPHAAGLEVMGSKLTAGIEMPPMDPALALDQFHGVLRHEWDLHPIRFEAAFREGW